MRFGNAPAPFANRSGFPMPHRFVVRDEAAWRETWAILHQGQSPMPSRPDVDFMREVIVVVALGKRPTTGYDILIDSVVALPSHLTVWTHTVVPGFGCLGAEMLTQPVDLARLPRIDTPVEFRDGPDVANCS